MIGWFRRGPLAATLILAACATSQSPIAVPVPTIVRPVEHVNRGDVAFQGALTQGAMLLGTAPVGTAKVMLDGKPVAIDANRRFVIGFGRDAAPTATMTLVFADGAISDKTLRIAPRIWKIESIPSLVQTSKPDPEYERIRSAELAQIRAARAQHNISDGWQQRFMWPATGRISGVYGSQRILGGVPRNPHAGVDVARPAGTPVVAPADGVVVLAAARPFSLEGNLLIIDHGMGVNSAFLHLSRIDVTLGQRITRGQLVGAIGKTGRATGPHLHWAMNWGDVRLDPQLLVPPMVVGEQ